MPDNLRLKEENGQVECWMDIEINRESVNQVSFSVYEGYDYKEIRLTKQQAIQLQQFLTEYIKD